MPKGTLKNSDRNFAGLLPVREEYSIENSLAFSQQDVTRQSGNFRQENINSASKDER